MNGILKVIAQRYRSSRAGKRADAVRDLIIPFPELLKEAGCISGEDRHEAIKELEHLELGEILELKRHRYDAKLILEVRLPLRKEDDFFLYLDCSAPNMERDALAEIFLEALPLPVPEAYREGWERFCRALAEAARAGDAVKPFDREKPDQAREIMTALPRVLNWEGESLMRFVSAALFRDSKALETWRSAMEVCLGRITNGKITRLADLGILENERSFMLHGPLTLLFPEGAMRTGLLEYPVRLGAKDLRRAQLATIATRCVTVENAAMLYELAKLRSDVLLASSGSEGGYANSAVIDFLGKLPPEIELWHFGDSDPKGFDILRDLRARTGRTIHSLHMQFRPGATERPLSRDNLALVQNLLLSEDITEEEKWELQAMKAALSKGDFEQESLGRPQAAWPFYVDGLPG